MPKSRSRTPVARPLTAAVVAELGVLGDDWPPRSREFQPKGNWIHTYRIWTCHGYRESGNTDQGYLVIERRVGASDDHFSLRVEQQVVHKDGIWHSLHARITCRNNQIASPEEWDLASRFWSPSGKEHEDLRLDTKGRLRSGRAVFRSHGRTYEIPTAKQVTADWCLVEAVQRLPRTADEWLTFDVLEDLTVHRPGQRLAYKGPDPVKLDAVTLQLHRFCQLGHGMLPYQYWLDDHQRLLLFTTLSRAYVLDPKARALKGDAA